MSQTDTIVAVRLSSEDRAALKAIAEREDRNISGTLRWLIRREIKRAKPSKNGKAT